MGARGHLENVLGLFVRNEEYVPYMKGLGNLEHGHNQGLNF